MAYDRNDPRASLSSTTATLEKEPATDFAAPEYFKFYETPPQETEPNGTRTWYCRGQNFVLTFSEAKAGTEFSRRGQPDEYVVLLPKIGASFTTNDGPEQVPPFSLVIVPPGDSSFRVTEHGQVLRLFAGR